MDHMVQPPYQIYVHSPLILPQGDGMKVSLLITIKLFYNRQVSIRVKILPLFLIFVV